MIFGMIFISLSNEISTKPVSEIDAKDAYGGSGGSYGMPSSLACFFLKASSLANAALQSNFLTLPSS